MEPNRQAYGLIAKFMRGKSSHVIRQSRKSVKFAKKIILLTCRPYSGSGLCFPCRSNQLSNQSMGVVEEKITVWDVPVRLFHWTLVLSFTAAYLTAEFHLGFLHVWVGYFLCLLLAFRVVWGFAGSRYARFASFIFSPGETLAYLRAMMQGNPKHYFGHNPAGALMVFALLALLALIFLTGLTTLAVIDFEGPMLFLVDYFDDDASYAMRHLHDWLVNAALVLIPLHLIGVAAGSIQHKENLVRAMLTGKKKNVATDVSEH
jgi:cytochrome b